jgi:hypothetical protein
MSDDLFATAESDRSAVMVYRSSASRIDRQQPLEFDLASYRCGV